MTLFCMVSTLLSAERSLLLGEERVGTEEDGPPSEIPAASAQRARERDITGHCSISDPSQLTVYSKY